MSLLLGGYPPTINIARSTTASTCSYTQYTWQQFVRHSRLVRLALVHDICMQYRMGTTRPEWVGVRLIAFEADRDMAEGRLGLDKYKKIQVLEVRIILIFSTSYIPTLGFWDNVLIITPIDPTGRQRNISCLRVRGGEPVPLHQRPEGPHTRAQPCRAHPLPDRHRSQPYSCYGGTGYFRQGLRPETLSQ